MKQHDLEGQVAIVTGGTRGIGRAVSLRLGARGAAVVMPYLRNAEAAHAAVAELEDAGVTAEAVRCNVGRADHLEQMFDRVNERFGRLDILISNAATGVIRPLVELDERAWAWTMDANARALFLCAKHADPLMRAGGVIVAMSSAGSTRVLPGYGVVGASKAALEALVRYLAVELAPRVRVNVVSAGIVDTDALRHFPMRSELLDRARAATPAGRLVTPDDVASAVDFLTSPGAHMVTGHTLVVDGGVSVVA